MLAKRQPLLWAFAGGCLWGAGLIIFWGGDGHSTKKQGVIERFVDSLTPALSATSPDGASDARAAESHAESAADEAHNDAGVEAAPPKDTADGGAARTEAGSSVADVLMRLEGAYREGLAVAPIIASASAGPTPAPAGPSSPLPAAEPAPAPATAALAEAPQRQVQVPAHEEAAVATAPPRKAPSAAPLAANAPETAGAVPLDAGDSPPSHDAHALEVAKNNYVGSMQQYASVQQSNLYVAQQLAILQYLQLMALSPYGQVAGAGRGYRAAPPPRVVPFPTTLTNPDNPWGYTFAPPDLVH